jgi:hypothetical protein
MAAGCVSLVTGHRGPFLRLLPSPPLRWLSEDLRGFSSDLGALVVSAEESRRSAEVLALAEAFECHAAGLEVEAMSLEAGWSMAAAEVERLVAERLRLLSLDVRLRV